MKSRIPYFNQHLQQLKNGSDYGYCRICNKNSKLTVDHVPPASCGNKHKLIVTIDNNSFISQNGFNCKTICEDCNNRLLGSIYDKEFKLLYDRLNSFKKSKLVIPSEMLSIDVNVINLFRSILGHFLAVNVHGDESIVSLLSKPIDDENSIFEQYRKFVLGELDSITNHQFYYWYFPFYEIKIRPYLGMSVDIRNIPGTALFGTLIKIFPIAIFIVDTTKSKALPDTDYVISSMLPTASKLEINTSKIVHKHWPEHPTKFGFVLENSQSTIEIRR